MKKFTDNQLQELEQAAHENNLEVSESTGRKFTAEMDNGRTILSHKSTQREQGGPTIYTVEYHDQNMEVMIDSFHDFDEFKEFVRTFGH